MMAIYRCPLCLLASCQQSPLVRYLLDEAVLALAACKHTPRNDNRL